MSKRPKDTPEPVPSEPKPANEIRFVALADIDPNPRNPRRHVDAVKLAELEASIREKGIEQSLLIRRMPNGRFEVVAGMQRYGSALAIGLVDVPAIITTLTDAEAREAAIIENIQRHDMHVVDEARAYAELQQIDARVYTVAKIATRFGVTESHVYRRLKLLDLGDDLLDALEQDRLSIGHAEKLCRLPAKLRAEAAHPIDGVVWRRNPLLEYGEKWIPTREDLRPLNELENFVRTRSHFDPVSEDAKHFQPGLVEQLQPAAGAGEATDHEEDANDEDRAAEFPGLVELSDDPMARMRLHAGKTDRIPLTPSRWREVKSASGRCPFTVRGVITHGNTAGRVLDVCVTKRCQKHFPTAKTSKSAKTATPSRSTGPDYYERERLNREKEEKAWEALRPVATAALAKHLAGVKFSARLVSTVVDSHRIQAVKRNFGVSLTDKTAVQVLVLSTISTHWRGGFAADCKQFKFDFAALERRFNAEQAAAAKATTKVTTKADATGKTAKKKGKAAA